MRFALRGSSIARGLWRAEGTYLDGMTTYLFKLGPKNLGSYAVAADRKIAASLPALAVRLRLADMARLLADALAPQLEMNPRAPVHLLNIAGGPGTDSINAILLLSRERPSAVLERRFVIRVLDADARGPAFGARAVASLTAPGAPLERVSVELVHEPYDWSSPAGLEPALSVATAEGAIVVGSSEGGLFEYGSDEAIVANLAALRRAGPSFRMVGSVTRNDTTIQTLKLTSTAATRPRGLAVFSELAAQANFRLLEAIARPLSDQVLLAPR